MALNVIIFYVTLPVVAGQLDELGKLGTRIGQFIEKHQELLADENVREKLTDMGMMSKMERDAIEDQLKKSPEIDAQYKEWLRGIEGRTYASSLIKNSLNSKSQRRTAFGTSTDSPQTASGNLIN